MAHFPRCTLKEGIADRKKTSFNGDAFDHNQNDNDNSNELLMFHMSYLPNIVDERKMPNISHIPAI